MLNEHSLWYNYKTPVWNTKTEQANTVHNIMRTLRAIRNIPRCAYVSVPITSGKFFYDLLLKGTPNALQEAINHNYMEGFKFVEELALWVDCPIIYPADLTPVHQEWEQQHFQALWLSIIAEKCSEVHMSKGWEFSNGGTEEFVHCFQLKLGVPKHSNLLFFNTKMDEAEELERMKNIKVYDHKGDELSMDDGIEKIQAAIVWLETNNLGHKTTKLKNSLNVLEWTKESILAA